MATATIKATLKGLTPRPLLPLWARIESSPIGTRLARGAFWSLFGAITSRGWWVARKRLCGPIAWKSRFWRSRHYSKYHCNADIVRRFRVWDGRDKVHRRIPGIPARKAGRVLALSNVVSITTGGLASLALFFSSPCASRAHVFGAAPHRDDTSFRPALAVYRDKLSPNKRPSGLEAFRSIAKINITCGLVSFPVLLSATYFGGITGATWAWVVTAALNCYLTQTAITRECKRFGIPRTLKGFWQEKSLLKSYSLPVFISSISFTCAEWILNTTLTHQSNGYSELGVFNAARQWHQMIIYLPATLANVTLPLLANLIGKGDGRAFRNLLMSNSLVFSGLGLVVAVPTAILSQKVMGAYGNDFADGWVTHNSRFAATRCYTVPTLLLVRRCGQ